MGRNDKNVAPGEAEIPARRALDMEDRGPNGEETPPGPAARTAWRRGGLSMRTRRWSWWYVAVAVPVLALAVWAATPPPPQGHPKMKVAPSVQKLHDTLVQVTEKAAKKGDYVCC